MDHPDLKIQTTWQLRIVEAVAKRFGCKHRLRSKTRVIGGRETSKVDRHVSFEGEPLAAGNATHATIELMAKLNTGSDRYAAKLPTDLSPNERKVARRAWLEAEAAKEADRLLHGGG